MSKGGKTMKNNKQRNDGFDFRDPVVTACSLVAIGIQSLIIILGFMFRWDWLAWECAVVLIVPAAVILAYGIKAIIEADKLMTKAAEGKEGTVDGQIEN